jgi:hypothetical protein
MTTYTVTSCPPLPIKWMHGKDILKSVKATNLNKTVC